MEERIQEAMVTREIFRISIGRFSVPITESMITMWIGMIALIVIAYIFSRNLKVIPGKKQSLVEVAIEFIGNMCKNTMGHYWKYFVPYIGMVMMFLILCNMISVFNIIPTSKDLYRLTHIEFFNKILGIFGLEAVPQIEEQNSDLTPQLEKLIGTFNLKDIPYLDKVLGPIAKLQKIQKQSGRLSRMFGFKVLKRMFEAGLEVCEEMISKVDEDEGEGE